MSNLKHKTIKNKNKLTVTKTKHLSHRKRCKKCNNNSFIEYQYNDFIDSRDNLIIIMEGLKLNHCSIYYPCNNICSNYDNHYTASMRIFHSKISFKSYHEEIHIKVLACKKCRTRTGLFTLKKRNSKGDILKGKFKITNII